MTQKITVKKGDLILYDKFGTLKNTISPSQYLNDFGIGIIVEVFVEPPGGDDNSFAKVMKDDGKFGFYSLDYLNSIECDDYKPSICSSAVSPQVI